MRCDLNRGLICDGQIQPIGSVCQDYEVQVWCHCDPNEPRMFPPFDPTATPPTVGGSIPTRSNGGDPNKPGGSSNPATDTTMKPPTIDPNVTRKFCDVYLNDILSSVVIANYVAHTKFDQNAHSGC